MNRKALIRLLFVVVGLGSVFISICAFYIGLDNDSAWGIGRYQMLLFGVCIFLIGISYWLVPKIIFGYINLKNQLVRVFFIKTTIDRIQQLNKNIISIIQKIINLPVIIRIRETRFYTWFSVHQNDVWLIIIFGFSICIYVWVITIGKFDKLPTGMDYYWMLSEAFQQGQTHLLIDPPSELMMLENPYEHKQRSDIVYLWDTSFYNGKYYLYWGPVPAIIGLIISLITFKPVTDALLVLLFVTGITLFSLLLLRDVQKDYQYPSWVFWGGVLASTVNIPLIFILARPKVYEASIAGGQFFVIAGFYALYRAFRTTDLHKGYLICFSIALGLACATRINLLASAIFLALLFLGWRVYISNQRRIKLSIPIYIITFTPLLLICVALFWYNYHRFDSILEFGHRYQLGIPVNDYTDTVSDKYIIPNLYTYIIRTPTLSTEFPFITIPLPKGREKWWPSYINIPKHYIYEEPVAGILFIVPLIGLTVLLIGALLWLLIDGDILVSEIKENFYRCPFSWYGLSMLGYSFIQMFILMIFMYSALRYLLDISQVGIVFSTLFIGYFVQFFKNRPYLLRIISSMWILASLLTVTSGLLIGFTGDANNFLNQNPQLYFKFFEWFSR
jgi:hypothetical protein